jgi:hypothetical protein
MENLPVNKVIFKITDEGFGITRRINLTYLTLSIAQFRNDPRYWLGMIPCQKGCLFTQEHN